MADIDPTDPPPPLPQTGEPGEPGHIDGTGGDGGTGGRGGIGLTGPRGPRGPAGSGGTGPAEKGDRGRTGATGADGKTQSTFDRYALAVVVVVTAISAIYFSSSAQQGLDDAETARESLAAQQDDFSATIDCQQAIVHDTIVALKARSTFAEAFAQATLLRRLAEARYLTVLAADPRADRPEALAALADYRKALQVSIVTTRDQLRIRDLHPYPRAATVDACGQ